MISDTNRGPLHDYGDFKAADEQENNVEEHAEAKTE